MNRIIIIILSLIILSSCASKPKFNVEKDKCKSTYGYFTKSIKCLELKFESSNPDKFNEYIDLHSMVMKALADQVYENKMDNNQAWTIYDDIIADFNKAKDKNKYLINVLDKYN